MKADYTVGEVELTYKSTSKARNKIYSSEDAYKYLLPTYKEGTICYKEYFKVLFLNQSNQVLGYTLISEGGITETCADVRVILQAALLTNSVAIILVLIYISTLENHRKGWSREIPEPVFSIYLTFLPCIPLNHNPLPRHKRTIRFLRFKFSINH